MIPAAIPFPQIDPDLISFNLFGMGFALRWYALAYIVGILIGWFIAVRAVARADLWAGGRAPMTRAQVEDLLFWVILGVVLGGRLGFVLFYQPGYYFANPLDIPKIWQGGMAFHGGFLGVAVAVALFAWARKAPVLSVADMLAIAAPPGILLGRLANFINAELYGRPSDVPWAMKFPTMCTNPQVQGCPEIGAWFYTGLEVTRHPSQLYEAALEGLVLGAVLLWAVWRGGILRRPGLATGIFFAGYGAARMFVELFRAADPQFVTPNNPVGYVVGLGPLGGGLTMGQVLSLPMVILGLCFVALALIRGRDPGRP